MLEGNALGQLLPHALHERIFTCAALKQVAVGTKKSVIEQPSKARLVKWCII